MPTLNRNDPDPAEQVLDQDTQVTGRNHLPAEARKQVPSLTILGHPDPSRVGDRRILPALAVGREIKISRIEPHFEDPSTGQARPMAVAHISRQPIQLSGGKTRGSIVLQTGSTRTPLIADGVEFSVEKTFSAQEIERGVTLELGHRVVLLLHTLAQGTTGTTQSNGLIGESEAMSSLQREIARVASLDVPVLLRGESGTGKELIARALHDAGGRRQGPFVAVSLAALPPTLAAAELFGAAKGAFTGADRKRQGFFQKANGGTLLLDEIGEAPTEVQVMLLRALETGEVVPVGSTSPVSLDVRVVAATDADLETAMQEKHFRAPLFHRLSGYTIDVPPLRSRRDDIGRLFFHFLQLEMRAVQSVVTEADGRPWPPTDWIAQLARADWPGNVRQLRNIARWLAVKGPDASKSELDKMLFVPDASAGPTTQPRREAPTPRPSRDYKLYRAPDDVSDDDLLEALRAHSWRLKPAAAQLNVSRTSLYALIDRSPRIRRARDLGRDELAESLERHHENLEAMSEQLKVSPQGIRRRLRELGVDAGKRSLR